MKQSTLPFLLVLFLSAFVASAAKRPNIIVIVADDLGYADIGCQNQSKDVLTPNIDSLAKAGVRFTDGYVSCPVCSPTRAGLMTGRYQQRFGHEFNPGPPTAAHDFGLSLDETTLPQRLKAAGYATGMFGKWHLGLQDKYNPIHRGFDEYFGFLHGRHDYFENEARDPQNPIHRGTEVVAEKDYLTEAFTREAVNFIDKHQKENFFIYLPYNAVHEPLEVLEKYKERFPNVTNAKRKTLLAMLAALDDGVGAVLQKLRDTRLEKNTLVFFISDNGGPTEKTSSRNDPLRGHKGDVWDGGIRVPFIVKWPGTIPAGKTYTNPVISLDIHATALAAAGVKLPKEKKLDGIDLVPFLKGKSKTVPHEFLYWRYGPQWAARSGDWKLTHYQKGEPKLYNLTCDISESKDVSAQNPEIAKKLQTAWDNWSSQMMAPRWHPGAKGNAVKKP